MTAKHQDPHEKPVGFLDKLEAEVEQEYDELLADEQFDEIYEFLKQSATGRGASEEKQGAEATQNEIFSLIEEAAALKQEQLDIAFSTGDQEQALSIINEALAEYALQETPRPAPPEPLKQTTEKEAPKGLADYAIRSVYTAVASLGAMGYRLFQGLLRLLKKLFVRPLVMLQTFLRLVWLMVDSFVLRSLHSFSQERRDYHYELRNAWREAKAGKQKRRIMLRAFFRSTARHKRLYFSVVNTLLPLGAMAVLLFTVHYWGGMTFALQVTYNNREIGYISDEAVYAQAKELANERISIGSNAAKQETQSIQNANYALKLVTLNKLNDAPTICDRLIENSEQNLTNACGIYVDNEFVCSVKNRADAENVFATYLEPFQKRTTDKNAFVAFVENIEYRPGLYPDDPQSMWDASQLSKRLVTPKVGKQTYVATEDDTDYDIARKHGLTETQLQALNPQMGKYVHPGDEFVVSTQVNFVQVKTIRTENREVNIGYTTEKVNNGSMFQGDNRTVRKGENGVQRVTEMVTYIDNRRVSVQEVSRTIVKEPVSAKVEVGTKSTKVYGYGGGSYNYSSKGFVWPAPNCHTISSRFGYRSLGYHRGVDLIRSGGHSSGALIVASRDGVVEQATYSGSYGYMVLINHGDGYQTRYAHMLSGSTSVSAGQRVSAGQAIGRVGNTGRSTGPHLHFEVIYRGSLQNPLNYIK